MIQSCTIQLLCVLNLCFLKAIEAADVVSDDDNVVAVDGDIVAVVADDYSYAESYKIAAVESTRHLMHDDIEE